MKNMSLMLVVVLWVAAQLGEDTIYGKRAKNLINILKYSFSSTMERKWNVNL